MRKMMLVGLVGASLGLASCGAQASIDQAVTSLGSSADLQLNFTGSASGPGTAQAQPALGVVSIDMNYSNPSGAALSQSGGTANAEILINAGTQTLADLRVVDSNLYVMLDISGAANIPGVKLPATEVAALQLLLGGRWFELPKSLLNSVTPTPSATSQAQTAKEAAAARAIFDDLSNLIAATPYTTLPNGGYSETGTLESVVKAVLPTIQGLGASTIPTSSVKGNYTLTVTASGSTATGGSITVTAPSAVAGQGDDTVGLNVTVAHASLSIDAPTGATVITPSLLKGLFSQAGG
jgi:hypothetical protein